MPQDTEDEKKTLGLIKEEVKDPKSKLTRRDQKLKTYKGVSMEWWCFKIYRKKDLKWMNNGQISNSQEFGC